MSKGLANMTKGMAGHGQFQARAIACLVATTVLVLSLLGSHAAAGSNKGRWFEVSLEQGKTKGYHWAVGAKGQKHLPLSKICAQISMVEPLRDDVPYAEGRDATDCSQLKWPSDSVASSVSFRSGPSRVTILELLYRPVVRKVTFILDTGERRVFRPKVPRIPDRSARGIPVFRYLVAPFIGSTCIRRITTFDERDGVIHNEARPACQGASGNV
jgi:hypothetical protein